MNKAFDIIENPWWENNYCSPQKVGEILKNVESYRSDISQQFSPKDPYWKGYINVHHVQYLFECITGEGCATNVTYYDVEKGINANFLIMFWYYLFNKRKHRFIKKLKNINNATNKMFPNICVFKQLPLENFDVDFVKKLHKRIGKNIIPNAGSFRTTDAKPAQENFFYLRPHLIEQCLEELLKECRQRFSEPDLSLEDGVKYGAYFLSNFLFIHPFSNGNGRVGRLLLSYLLAKYTIVPLSLYTTKAARDTYLQCLRESREFHAEFNKPSSLSRFILENIQREFLDLYYLMDLFQNNKFT